MPHQRFLTAIGLATVNSARFTKNPFQMMHSNVWTRWPVVSDPSFPAFITRARLDGLLGECQAVKSLADLPPVA